MYTTPNRAITVHWVGTCDSSKNSILEMSPAMTLTVLSADLKLNKSGAIWVLSGKRFHSGIDLG